MPYTDHITNVNGINLSYREWQGKKGPLICLPSLMGHKGSFDALAERLAPEYHLFAFDLRGRGDSDKPQDGYGFAYHTRDILTFTEALAIEKFGMIGHSYGATVAVYLASIRPLLVQALVMIDGGVDPKEEVLEAMRPALRRLGSVYPSIQEYFQAMQELPYYAPWNPALESVLRQDVETLPTGEVRSRTSAEHIERDLDLHFYYSMCVHFPTLQCPTMFIRPQQGLLGNRAHVLDEREAAAFVNSIPKCWRVDLPDVNHFTMLLSDDPLVAPPIKAFLSTIYKEVDLEAKP